MPQAADTAVFTASQGLARRETLFDTGAERLTSDLPQSSRSGSVSSWIRARIRAAGTRYFWTMLPTQESKAARMASAGTSARGAGSGGAGAAGGFGAAGGGFDRTRAIGGPWLILHALARACDWDTTMIARRSRTFMRRPRSGRPSPCDAA